LEVLDKVEGSVLRGPWQAVAVRIFMHVHRARLIGPSNDVDSWVLCSREGSYLANEEVVE
jgi:hypothetical protein